MPIWNQGLEGVQLEIAQDTRSPIHVFAGPGTGKTFTMMRRIARFLEGGVNPDRILAVAFTRTAARDLKEQLELLGVPRSPEVRASTLHSLCFSILAHHEAFAITHRSARPLLSHERRILLSDLAERFGGMRSVRELMEAYEAAWARLQTDTPGGPSADIDVDFHTAVVDWLQYHRSMLLGELVPLTLKFLQQNPAIPVLPAIEHLLVDEYQDMNKADQALIDKIARHGTLTVIGDDSQSIYGFRYANPEGIRTFPQTHMGTVPYTIVQCRRCPPNIVEMSNALIAQDLRRLRSTPLTADSGCTPAQIFIVQHQTLEDEIEASADFITHYLEQRLSLPPGQVLVLTPRRFIGNRIRDALITRRLNATSFFSEDALQEVAAAEGFCLLTLLVDPSDRTALRTWIGIGSSNALVKGYRRLQRVAQEQRREPAQILEAIASGNMRVPHTTKVVDRWILLQQRFAQLSGLNCLELVRALWPPDRDDCSDIRVIAENLAINAQDPPELLEELRQEITQPYLPDSRSDVIRVMSFHKSKGLTASLVLVAGCMAGALPSIDTDATQALQDFQLEEQRRLFYVAITRASETLVVSSSVMLPITDAYRNKIQVYRKMWYHGESFAITGASPFLNDLGPSAPSTINTNQWRNVEGF